MLATLGITWDWTAIGTLAVAAFTAVLGWQTRQLARQSNRDVQAQWTPVILGDVPRSPPPQSGQVRQLGVPLEHSSDQVLEVPIRNVGRGPALEVNGTIYFGTDPISTLKSSLISLAPSDTGSLMFHPYYGIEWREGRPSEKEQLLTVSVKCHDLTGQPHESLVFLKRKKFEPRMWIDYSTYIAQYIEPISVGVKRWLIKRIPQPIRRRIWPPQPRIGSGGP
jgi:hypothetical protein